MTTAETRKAPSLSSALVNASILLYTVWLLLPAVQTTGRALTGGLTVCLFGVGVLCDLTYVKKQWPWLMARALCMALVPLLLRRFLNRGGDAPAGFLVQQVMFWFPLVFAAYARERGDARLWRFVRVTLLACVTITLLTTIGWLIQGMLRGGRVYAYSRSLGYGGEGREAYLKELMLRNIGGYDFIYAMAAAVPLTCIGIHTGRGRDRLLFSLLLAAQAVCIALSQYTYAMLYAAAVLAVELFALCARKWGHVSLGKSLLIGLIPLVLGLLLARPMAVLAAQLCDRLGLTNFAFSFEQVAAMLGGQTSLDPESRLGFYLTAWEGIKRSPIVGSLFGAPQRLSQHSEVLDLLSGTGLLGTCAFGGMVWLMGRGLLRGAKHHPQLPRLIEMAAVIGITALLGTVFYSRDVMLVAALGTLLVLET